MTYRSMESVIRDIMTEKKLTPAEKKKREEVAQAIERDNPDMPMDKKMAIATAQAKKVAEEVEELDESLAVAKELRSYADKHGGIDKADFHKAADHVEAVHKAGLLQKGHHLEKLNNHIKNMDTDPRDKVHEIIKKHSTMSEAVEELDEKLNKDSFHTSVEKGKFMKSKYGSGEYQNAMFLHDLDNKGSEGKPMLVTFTRQADAEKTAKKHGGKIIKSGMNTFRIIKEEVELEEATPSAKQVKQGIGIARDKRYAGGNMTGAVKTMNKINKGLAGHPAVAKELQKQNEEYIEEESAIHNLGAGYTARSEKSKFTNGHRAKIMGPHGKVSYLSGTSFKSEDDAIKHAKDYHKHVHINRRSPESMPKPKNVVEGIDYSDTGGAEEVSMAMNQVKQIRHYIDGIEKMVAADGDMEEWVQNKLTKATDYLKSVYGYKTGKNEQFEMDMQEAVETNELMKAMMNLVDLEEKARLGGSMKAATGIMKKQITQGGKKSDMGRNESTDAYGKSVEKQADDKKKAAMTDSDKQKLGALANLMAKERMKKEEVELDELDKKTLGSYVNKAARDSVSKAYGSASAAKDNRPDTAGKDFSKSMKRLRGIETATRKLTKEEYAEFEEILGEDFEKHLKYAVSNNKNVQSYLSKKADERRAMNKKNDPGAEKKGLALSVVDRQKAYQKGKKKGIGVMDINTRPGKDHATGKPNYKPNLPEEIENILNTVITETQGENNE